MNSTQQLGPWLVLNCHVTQILGHYPTEAAATLAAHEFGNCSFAHELTRRELEAMAAQH